MNAKVKICGIQTIENAQIAIANGADYLGFNFVPTSKRYIDPNSAKTIISNISGYVQAVGVFLNQQLSYVNELIEYLSLDFAQLHGVEDIEYIKNVNTKVIKTIHEIPKHMDIPFFLLDRKYQGKGKLVNLEKAKLLSQSLPLFIAGGLTPVNVGEVIRIVRPYGVDVAGGIEVNGIQNEQKIINFISNAKAIKL